VLTLIAEQINNFKVYPSQIDFKALSDALKPLVDFSPKRCRKIWDGYSQRLNGTLKKENSLYF